MNSGLALSSCVKAPLEYLIQQTNYHFNIGVDHVIFFFDDPKDKAIAHFSNHKKVTCFPCDTAHWEPHGGRPKSVEERQIVNFQIGAQVAKDLGMKWLCNIDHDELIHPNGDLCELLSRINTDQYIPEVREAVCTRLHYDSIFHAEYFKSNPTPARSRWAKKYGCQNAFVGGRYLRGHNASKAIVNLSADVDIYGIHRSKGKNLTSKMGNMFYLLHFDSVGIDGWIEKWHQRYEDNRKFSSMGDTRHELLSYYANAVSKGKQALTKAYRRFYCLGPYERFILKRCKILERIKLDKTLFNAPPEDATTR